MDYCEENGWKWMVGYVWALSVLGACLFGHEIAMSKRDAERSIAQAKIDSCNRTIMGEMYEKAR